MFAELKTKTIRGKFVLLLLLMMAGEGVQAGGLDSLERLLSTRLPDTVRIKTLGDLCFAYRQRDTARAWKYGSEALALSEKIHYETGIAQSYNDLGILLFDKSAYDEALQYYQNSLAIRTRMGDQKGVAAIYNKIGIVFQTQGRYSEAVANQMQALKIYERIGFDYGISSTLNNMAIIYGNMGRPDKALEYHHYSLAIKERMGDMAGVAGSYSNIGSIYFKLNQHDSAITNMRKAERMQRELGDYFSLAATLNNMGSCYKMDKNRDAAIACIKEAYDIRRQLDDKPGLVSSMQNLAQVYLLMSKPGQGYPEALDLLTKALAVSRELGTRSESEKICNTLAAAYEELHEYKLSYTYYKMCSAYHDSVFNEESSRQIAEMQTRYETSKKEASIKLLTKDNAIRQQELVRKQTTVRIMLIGLGVVSVLLLLILRLYRQKAVANSHLQQLDKEKNEFLGIAAHDLKNPLQTILGYCQMQVDYFDKLSKEKILKYTGNIELSARRMIVLISNLLDINAIEQGTIQPRPEPIELSKFLQKANQNFEVSSRQKSIGIHTTCAQGLVLETDRYMLSQVYENLLGNALKFSPLNSQVEVNAERTADYIRLAIRDAGPGITAADREKLFRKFSRLSNKPTGGESSSGLGLSIVKKLSDMLGASVSCDSEPGKGTTFTVSFPLTDSHT